MGIFDFLKKEDKKGPDLTSFMPQQIYESGVLELKDVIAPSALQVSPREVNLGDKVARSFFVISYPRYLSDNWFSPIINLDRVFDVSIFVHPIQTEKIMRQLQKKVAENKRKI